ncbi:YihY/virulence factor BrkB family protein [Nocardioides sp. TRM66260-LWL]|uniref:YihY/virulence factor BrkB family protein n=1 Tax=Nocardioides sp. TRM66260-LWL TaxID=2874478 RepID=UPI001CC38E9B|nr:YihY/virulence factor BrkB family protein [Nocardioides sp. TRM66260-LWL]MBZ5733244.1 YihY/virulence factor BrkB family protein [Nocardioides sp. TRM66260-LWL]
MKDRLARLRARYPVLDRILRMQEHYGSVQAGQQAGAVTYFAFLSFFPVLALAVFVVGLVSKVYPDADADLQRALDSVVPGILDGSLSLKDLRTFSGLAGVVGLLGVLYSGLGWLSALRGALTVVFAPPEEKQPSFVAGKLRDLASLVVLGSILFVAVAVTGFVAGFSGDVLGFLGLDSTLGWVVRLLSVALGLAANAVLFFAMFRLLAAAHLPASSLWQGAVLGAVLFEVLKQLAGLLLAGTRGSPAFQAFGVALILVVWINYFTRLVLYCAAWSATSPAALAVRPFPEPDPVQGPALPSAADLDEHGVAVLVPHGGEVPVDQPRPWQSFAVGAGVGAAVGALLSGLRSR